MTAYHQPPGMSRLQSLDHAQHPARRTLTEAALEWMAPHWDDATGLLWMITTEPHPTNVPPGTRVHVVRDSLWAAVGLLDRDGVGDRERALRAIEAALATQLVAPGTPHHGTFKRAPEEPVPPADSVVWKDFDPNWREFVGTMLIILLEDFRAAMPRDLAERMERALRWAAEGSLARNVPASYTNIALMAAFLLRWCGDRFGEQVWGDAGDRLASETYGIHKEDETFPEFNSPTYYGVNLFALALWRSYSGSAETRRMGEEMEAGLWRDVARFYHAGLRNVCGPYDRSYGMDMTEYAAILGLWVWAALGGEDAAPFPDWRRPFGHTNDFCVAPTVAHLGARVPDEARAHLLAFQGERSVERVISREPRRVATAWLGERLMVGAQDASGAKAPRDQYHPATAHWRLPGGGVGWLRVRHAIPVDARASERRLEVWASEPGEAAIELRADGLATDRVTGRAWQLPGLSVRVETEARVTVRGEGRGGGRVLFQDAARPVRLTLVLEESE